MTRAELLAACLEKVNEVSELDVTADAAQEALADAAADVVNANEKAATDNRVAQAQYDVDATAAQAVYDTAIGEANVRLTQVQADSQRDVANANAAYGAAEIRASNTRAEVSEAIDDLEDLIHQLVDATD